MPQMVSDERSQVLRRQEQTDAVGSGPGFLIHRHRGAAFACAAGENRREVRGAEGQAKGEGADGGVMPRMWGLALSGGGVKCAAHLGVLKVLQRHGVEFDLIAGSSAGALVAVLYGLGTDLAELERRATQLRWQEIIGWRISRQGLGDPNRFLRLLRSLTRGVRLEDLPRRVLVTATDLRHGTPHIFERGEAAEAIYASCALPGLFPPLQRDGRVLVDGSVLSPLPVDLLKRHGARHCVGVLFDGLGGYEPRSLLASARRCFDVMLNKLAADVRTSADILVTPALGDCGSFDFRQIRVCIAEGERAAQAVLPALLRLREGAPAVVITPGGAGQDMTEQGAASVEP